MCAPAVGKNNLTNMLSKHKRAERSERAVYQSNLQKRFTRSVRKSSLYKHKRKNDRTKAAPKITTNKKTLVAHANNLIIKI